MKNLAGLDTVDCEVIVKKELADAGIEVLGKNSVENPEDVFGRIYGGVVGRLGKLIFRRSWSYWMVEGMVPLAVAEELYADEIGWKDVRVQGHIGRPRPGDYAFHGHVWHYHIDSETGLKLFADKIKKYGLA